jgi:hypothetical protein
MIVARFAEYLYILHRIIVKTRAGNDMVEVVFLDSLAALLAAYFAANSRPDGSETFGLF